MYGRTIGEERNKNHHDACEKGSGKGSFFSCGFTELKIVVHLRPHRKRPRKKLGPENAMDHSSKFYSRKEKPSFRKLNSNLANLLLMSNNAGWKPPWIVAIKH
jgi:hypothetical protein